MPELLEPPVVVPELLLPATVPVLEDDGVVVVPELLVPTTVPVLEDDGVAVVPELLVPAVPALEDDGVAVAELLVARAMVEGASSIPKQEKSSMDKEPSASSSSITSHANLKILLAAKSFF